MHVLPLFENASSVLCVGAHPDDIEIGCGGTILALLEVRPEIDVHWLILTGSDVRRAEAARSAWLYLGDAAPLHLHQFRDGFLPYDDPSGVKEAMIAVREQTDPDLVFVPRLEDAHQDHRLVAELSWQVFRNQLIAHYEIAKYEGDLGGANLYVPLTDEQTATKIDRLFDAFPSQHDKPWFRRETFAGLMRLRGVEAGAGAQYAEAFTVPKLVVR